MNFLINIKTVSGTNLAGLRASAYSAEYILDSSPPVTGQIEFDDDVEYISKETLVIRLVGFLDDHSGIAYYSVGIGTSNITADILPANHYFSDVIEISIAACDIRDGHKYYIIVQVINNLLLNIKLYVSFLLTIIYLSLK